MAKQAVAPLVQRKETVQAPPHVQERSPFLYGLGILAINILLESFSAYAYFFYIEILGLAMSMAAVVKMIYAIWNSANDPIFGFLSDNTRSRWGRRHIWLAPGMLLTSVLFILIFSVPASIQGTPSLFWYMLAVLLLFETVSTIMIVNYAALFPEYFLGLKQRSKASVYYQAGKIIAVLMGLTLTPLVYRAIGFTGMAVCYAILSICLLAPALLGNREDPIMQAAARVEFLPAFQNVLRDRSFWQYGVTITLITFGVNMAPFTLPFYVKHALGAGPGLASILSGAALITCLLVLPLWARLLQAWKMKNTFLAVILIMSIGIAMMTLPPNRWIAMSAIAVIGIAWGGIWICNNIIRADLVSQNSARTGRNTEALYYGLLNVIQNMGGIMQSIAMLLASLFCGYVSGEEPGPQPAMAFRFLMGFAPLAVLVISWPFVHAFLRDYSGSAAE
jgi:GPH family glycoside/pentoside/hexuronide:cation symporter